MLGYNQTWELEVNSTAQEIENCLNTTYKQIVNYFLDKNISNKEKLDFVKEIENKLQSSSSFSDRYGSSILNIYKNLDKNEVYSIINGKDNIDIYKIASLSEMIIMFSIFDFNIDNKCFGIKTLPSINNDDEDEIFVESDIYGTTHGYCFFEGSRLFNLLDIIYGDSWKDIEAWIWKNSVKKIKFNLRQALLNGYIEKEDDDNVYIIFEEKDEIIDFIYKLIYDISFENNELKFGHDEKISFIRSETLSKKLAIKIKNTLEAIIDAGSQLSRNSKVKEVQLGDSNNQARLVFSAADNDTIYRYIDLYDEYIRIFKGYLEELKQA